MKRVLVIDAGSGLSGDMFVAAAAALAGCEEEVTALPKTLGLTSVTCRFVDTIRASIGCRKFEVLDHGVPAESVQPHVHPHKDGQEHAVDDSSHRPLNSILRMIEASGLESGIKQRAARMFQRLGEIEAAAHGVPIETVHFHEVGAIDSIIDIMAAAVCIERLQISQTICSTVCVGSGMVATAHGLLPIPAPATEALLRGLVTEPGILTGEWTTPTGALILHELKPIQTPPALAVSAAAYGAGGRNPASRPNALRLRLGEMVQQEASDRITVISCNLDDTPPELLGERFIASLLERGALDASLQPVVMKKGRPGWKLELLCMPEDAERFAGILLTETSTIGVRFHEVQRIILAREETHVETEYGRVACKSVRLADGSRRVSPEFESCAALAKEAKVPVQAVYRSALKECI